MKFLLQFVWLLFIRPLRSCLVEEGEAATAFEDKVLTGIEKMQTKQDALVSDVSRLDKDTKAAFEDLTKVKNNLNSVADFEASLKKVQLQMRREQRMAYGDPIQRISRDEDLRKRLNIAIRLGAAQQSNAKHLINVAQKIDGDLCKKALDEANTPGSTLITTDLANEIYDVLSQFGAWPTLGVMRVGTKTTKFPVTTARPLALAVRKLSSAKLAQDSTLAGTSVDQDVVLWGVLLGVYKELMEDSEFDVTSYVLENFGEAMAFRMDHVGFVADGTDDSADSEMTGMFYAGTAAGAASGNTTIETLDYEDVLRCLTTVASVVLQRSARWWMHPTNLARLLAVKDLSGRPIFLTAVEAPTYGGLGSILGFPVTVSGALPSANTTSSKVAAFGDGRSQVFGLRSDVEFDNSDQFAFDAAQTTFRMLARFGTKNRAATGSAILTLAAS